MPDSSAAFIPRWATIAAFIVALGCVTLLFLWKASDASFEMAVWQSSVTLRLQEIPLRDPESAEAFQGLLSQMRTLHWDRLGKRVALLWTLCGLGGLSTILVALVAASHRTSRNLLSAIILLAAWTAFGVSSRSLEEWRIQRQLSEIFPQIESLAGVLQENWPKQSGEIAPGVRVTVKPERYPDLLLLKPLPERTPFREGLGHTVHRRSQGVLCFDLAAASMQLQHHPQGTFPSPGVNRFGHETGPLDRVIEFRKQWYLVSYGE